MTIIKKKKMNNHYPKISVVIPAYNAEKYIGRAIDSVVSQSYKPLEIIVINDGSSDSTLNILNKYDIIQTVNQSNSGVWVSRNKGAFLAKGDFIAFLDADDEWEKDKLQKQVDVIQRHQGISVLTTLKSNIDHKGDMLGDENPIQLPLNQKIYPYEYLIMKGNPFCMSSAMIRKSDFTEIRGFREEKMLSLDYDLWIRLAAEKNAFWIVGDKLTKYRILGNSLLHGSMEKEFGAQLKILELNKERYNEKKIKKRYAKIYYDWADSAFYCSDKSAWKAARKSLKNDPYNIETYKLIAKGLIKSMINKNR